MLDKWLPSGCVVQGNFHFLLQFNRNSRQRRRDKKGGIVVSFTSLFPFVGGLKMRRGTWSSCYGMFLAICLFPMCSSKEGKGGAEGKLLMLRGCSHLPFQLLKYHTGEDRLHTNVPILNDECVVEA